MKLIDFLNQRMEEEPDFAERTLKIGSSSGYFYCGTAQNFLKKLDAYDRKIEQFFLDAFIRAEINYETELKNPPTISGYAKEVIESKSKSKEFSFEDFESRINKWLKAACRKYVSKVKAAARKSDTKPLAQREVIESRMSDPIADDGVENIIVEGFEQGSIWMSSEVTEKGEFSFGEDTEEELQ